MKYWIIVGLILSTSFVQVEGFFGFIKDIFKGVGKVVGSLVKPVLGIDNFERQAKRGRNSVESGIATFNGNMANSLKNLDTYVKNDIIPEVKKLADSGTEMAKSAQDMAKNAQELVSEMTGVLIPAAKEALETARDTMVGITDSTQQVANSTTSLLDTARDVLIPEAAQTMNTSRWMMIQFVNITVGIQDRVGQSLNNVDYVLELSIALIFMIFGAVCGYELRRVGRVVRPRGFVAFEIHLLKWSRIVCFAFALLLAFHIILRVLQISIFSKLEKRIFFFLIPVLSVALYYAIRLLIKLLKLVCICFYYLFFVIKYLLYLPYNIIFYAFFSPFMLTYLCFIDRHNHPSRFPALVIYCMPVFFSVFYSGCEEIFEVYLNATKKGNASSDYSLAWLYSLVISYVLFHIIAIWLRFRYPPFVPDLPVALWLELLTRNHLPLTAVGSIPGQTGSRIFHVESQPAGLR